MSFQTARHEYQSNSPLIIAPDEGKAACDFTVEDQPNKPNQKEPNEKT